MGIPRQHMDSLDALAAYLEFQNLIRVQPAFADQSVTGNDNEKLPLAVVPVLSLGHAGLRDIHGKLSAAPRLQKLRKAAARVRIHLQGKCDFFLRQVGKIGGIQLLFQTARRHIRKQQRLGLGAETVQQRDDPAQCHAVRHRHTAEALTGNRRQSVILTAVCLPGQRAQQFRDQIVDIEQLQLCCRIADRDRQIAGNIVAEGRHGRIIVRAAPFPENIGEAVNQHLRAGFGGMGAQPLFAGALGFAVRTACVTPDKRRLRRACQHHGTAVACLLQGGQQYFQ